MTKDADFARALLNGDGCATVWLRLGNVTNDVLAASLEPIFDEVEAALGDGQRLVEVGR